ncbi:acylphosphatase [Candidatus Micrarchaeota archaeon]|nr:acylphosphatase [Candidatus Micrarchaeota archaeon]
MAKEEIVQAVFYIEPKEVHNRVQHIGCRLILTEKLIRAGFKKGGVFNLPDGRVEVVIEGEKKDVEAFYENVTNNLVKWLEEKTSNKERLQSMIGNPGITFSPIEIKGNLRVLDIGLFSHSLEMNQLENGVDVYYELTGAIKGLSGVLEKMDKKL